MARYTRLQVYDAMLTTGLGKAKRAGQGNDALPSEPSLAKRTSGEPSPFDRQGTGQAKLKIGPKASTTTRAQAP